MDNRRLYERAAALPKPLWHVGDECSLFAGPLGYNAGHQHSVPVYLVGLYSPFKLRIRGGAWRTCGAAVVPAGTTYELDVGGNPLAVLYLEASVGGHETLMPLVGNAREDEGVLIGSGGETAPLRELYECRANAEWTKATLTDLLAFAEPRARRALDPRVTRAVLYLQQAAGAQTLVADIARAVGLSASRLQHIFAEEVGVPFRQYRRWLRLRRAIREVVDGANFTTAAHAAGFADQAHFSNDFRRTFGAPPSASLPKLNVSMRS